MAGKAPLGRHAQQLRCVRVLPMPASPRSSTTWPSLESRQASISPPSCRSSAWRPTKGVSNCGPAASPSPAMRQRVNRLIDALHHRGPGRFALDLPADGAADGIGHQGFAGLRQAAQARGQVHGVADHRVFRTAVGSQPAGHDLPAGDADMQLQRPADLIAQLGDRAVHVGRRARRADGIIAMGNRRTEHRHDGVADVFAAAAIARHQAIQHGQLTVEQRMGFLRAQLRGHFGEPCEIGKQDRHRPVLAGRRRGRWRRRGIGSLPERLAATAAETVARLVGKPAGRTGLGQRRAALRAESPSLAIFGRTFLTEHAIPVRRSSKRLGENTQPYIASILRFSSADYIA